MPARKNGGEQVGALSARVDALIEAVREQRGETHQQFAEVRNDIGSLRVAISNHVATLQTRIETVERSDAAAAAVEKYRRWLIGTLVVTVGSLLFSLARALTGH